MKTPADPKLKSRLLAASFLLLGLFLVMMVARVFLSAPAPAAPRLSEPAPAVAAADPTVTPDPAAPAEPPGPAKVSLLSLWGRLALVLLAAYGLLCGVRWVRDGGVHFPTPEQAPAEPLLRVCDALSLGQGREIHLLEVGDTRLVLGSLPGQLVSLGFLPAPDTLPRPAPAAPAFVGEVYSASERPARLRPESVRPAPRRVDGQSEWDWEQRRARLIDALQRQVQD
ncbi:MAG TPA: flagellar biosynthetic protein FliO [Armatimonadota bacterium]|jgi:flagellar biogenesis protein FliO